MQHVKTRLVWGVKAYFAISVAHHCTADTLTWRYADSQCACKGISSATEVVVKWARERGSWANILYAGGRLQRQCFCGACKEIWLRLKSRTYLSNTYTHFCYNRGSKRTNSTALTVTYISQRVTWQRYLRYYRKIRGITAGMGTNFLIVTRCEWWILVFFIFPDNITMHFEIICNPILLYSE